MKFQIEHESRGRIRIRAVQKRMTLEQADLFEAWLDLLCRDLLSGRPE